MSVGKTMNSKGCLLSILGELLDAVMDVEHLALLQAQTIVLFLVEMAVAS